MGKCTAILVIAVAAVCIASPGLAWKRFEGILGAQAVAVDGGGDVYAAGYVYYTGPNVFLTVLRLDGATGALRWRATPAGTGYGRPVLRMTPDGSLIVVAQAPDSPVPQVVVLKLGADTGATVWQRDLGGAGPPGASFEPRVAIDANLDVVVATPLAGADATDFAVVKLSGTDGAEQWRSVLDGSAGLPAGADQATSLALAGADVIAGGYLSNGAGQNDGVIVRLDGDTGAVLWQVTVAGNAGGDDVVMGVGVQPGGDVLALARTTDSVTGGDILVLRLDGATGVEDWRRVFDGGPFGFDRADALAVASDGDAVVAGMVWPTESIRRLEAADGADGWVSPVFGGALRELVIDSGGAVTGLGGFSDGNGRGGALVLRLDGGTGAFHWRHVFVSESFNAIATGPDGHVAVVGAIEDQYPNGGFLVRRFADRLAGTRLRLRDKRTGPAGRLLEVAVTNGLIVASSPGEGADPTVLGGSLRVVNPATLEAATIALPAAGWTARTGRGRTLYTYRGGPAPGDCQRVVLQSDRKLRAKCSGMSFTLDEPAQGAVGVQLTIGDGAAMYCTQFGGTVVHDVAVGEDTVGQFLAKNAPPPPACPLP